MNIPLCDIQETDKHYRAEINSTLMKTIDDTNFILGKAVSSFEDSFSKYLGTKHSIGVSSCTMALYLALKAFGIKEGDEVIVPDFTIAADIEPVLMCNGTPVLCGVDVNGNIDPEEILKRITVKTKAIIVVHLYGKPCALNEIMKIKSKYGIRIIEDCAQSFGAEYNGKKVGSYTDISCHSFFPSKVLGGYGDGGMCSTDDDKLAEKIFMLRNHGRKKGERYKHDAPGVNSRLNALQAAILSVKIKYIDEAIEQRREAATIYNNQLKAFPEELLKPPTEEAWDKHVYYMYSARVHKRDGLLEHLLRNGISASIHYPMSLSQHPIYSKYYNSDKPSLETYKLTQQVISLPMFPGITEKQIEHVCGKIKWFYEKD